MKETFTKKEFKALTDDDQIGIISDLLFEDYFKGMEKIGFWMPENISDLDTEDLPEPPPEIAAEEERKYNQLIEELTIKLFSKTETIEFDLETLYEEEDEVEEEE